MVALFVVMPHKVVALFVVLPTDKACVANIVIVAVQLREFHMAVTAARSALHDSALDDRAPAVCDQLEFFGPCHFLDFDFAP